MVTVLGIWLIAVLPVGLAVAGGLRRAGVAQPDGASCGDLPPAATPVPTRSKP